MANTPSSLEVQIDNFLEHFKRSASKAMDSDWISAEPSLNYATTATTAASFNHSSPLKTAKTRSSCFDISQLGSMTGKKTWNKQKISEYYGRHKQSHPKSELEYVGYLLVIDRLESNRYEVDGHISLLDLLHIWVLNRSAVLYLWAVIWQWYIDNSRGEMTQSTEWLISLEIWK